VATVPVPLTRPGPLLRPISLRISELACMLNFELADHPVYDGGEVQWFDDEVHGTGMLVFLSRRGSRQVDYYLQSGLRVDRAGYEIGGGTGSWTEVGFEVARLAVADDGVDAEVRFTDVDGRAIEIRVDDRDGRPRRPAGLLAPVSDGIERPVSLLLVWMPRFDLVQVTGAPPVIRIDGVDAPIGRLPGQRLHRRHLVKYAAPVVTVEVNADRDGLLTDEGAGRIRVDEVGGIQEVGAEHAGHQARLRLAPAMPDLPAMDDGASAAGRWRIDVDEVRLTGGTWSTARDRDEVTVAMDVDERWTPGRLPWLMRVVTTVVPVFRRWPTTYRWRAQVRLGAVPTLTARWERTGTERGRGYRRATGT
jgi:hypothetical protein